MALLKHYKNHTKLAVPESKELASEGVLGVAVTFFELRLQSLAICDFEVAAVRVTKVGGQRGLARGNPSYARDSGIVAASSFLFLLLF